MTRKPVHRAIVAGTGIAVLAGMMGVAMTSASAEPADPPAPDCEWVTVQEGAEATPGHFEQRETGEYTVDKVQVGWTKTASYAWKGSPADPFSSLPPENYPDRWNPNTGKPKDEAVPYNAVWQEGNGNSYFYWAADPVYEDVRTPVMEEFWVDGSPAVEAEGYWTCPAPTEAPTDPVPEPKVEDPAPTPEAKVEDPMPTDPTPTPVETVSDPVTDPLADPVVDPAPVPAAKAAVPVVSVNG